MTIANRTTVDHVLFCHNPYASVLPPHFETFAAMQDVEDLNPYANVLDPSAAMQGSADPTAERDSLSVLLKKIRDIRQNVLQHTSYVKVEKAVKDFDKSYCQSSSYLTPEEKLILEGEFLRTLSVVPPVQKDLARITGLWDKVNHAMQMANHYHLPVPNTVFITALHMYKYLPPTRDSQQEMQTIAQNYVQSLSRGEVDLKEVERSRFEILKHGRSFPFLKETVQQLAQFIEHCSSTEEKVDLMPGLASLISDMSITREQAINLCYTMNERMQEIKRLNIEYDRLFPSLPPKGKLSLISEYIRTLANLFPFCKEPEKIDILRDKALEAINISNCDPSLPFPAAIFITLINVFSHTQKPEVFQEQVETIANKYLESLEQHGASLKEIDQVSHEAMKRAKVFPILVDISHQIRAFALN